MPIAVRLGSLVRAAQPALDVYIFDRACLAEICAFDLGCNSLWSKRYQLIHKPSRHALRNRIHAYRPKKCDKPFHLKIHVGFRQSLLRRKLYVVVRDGNPVGLPAEFDV
jgi:hypothetical protein